MLGDHLLCFSYVGYLQVTVICLLVVMPVS